MTGTAVQTQTKDLPPLERARQQVLAPGFAEQVKMALPKHISVDKFQRTVITALAKDAGLLNADRGSLFTACVEAASDGLLPNAKEAALVIYGKKVQYIPMIGGIYKKARNSGEISNLAAHVVYDNDEFDYELGFEPTLRHKPALGERGNIRCVYAIAIMKDGTKDMEVMTVAEIEQVRKASKAANNGPWVQWWSEMARKTAVRRLAKRLPLTADLDRVIGRMDAMYEFEQGKQDGPPRPSTASAQLSSFAAPAVEHHQDEDEGGEDATGEGDIDAEETEAPPKAEPPPAQRKADELRDAIHRCETVADLDALKEASQTEHGALSTVKAASDKAHSHLIGLFDKRRAELMEPQEAMHE